MAGVIRNRHRSGSQRGHVRCAAESGSVRAAVENAFALTLHSEYPIATQQVRPTAEPANVDGPSIAKPVSRPRSRKPAIVSASALALHLDCSRTYIGKLEAEGVNQRQCDGFPLDQSRVAYLRYLRRERRQSPRSEADADHVKTEMLQLRLMEKKRELVPRADVDELIDGIAGVTLTHLSGWPARIAGHDLGLRRKAEGLVHELRVEIAKACEAQADLWGEPPLAEQRELR